MVTPPPIDGRVELWGGVECTVNRVGDVYFDQLERNGHAQRDDDLDRFAEYGIRTLRFPLLWERIAPVGVERADWAWADRRMDRIQQLGVKPIVGLVHHGSGPRYTDLLDADFGRKLAEFAAAIAERYPWVTMFTPVNEPLTTARFSGLYAHWYPHRSDSASFVRALLNETKGTILAMRAIREASPDAMLVQTEDLGCTHSTPKLAYQARFENHRRWLSFDLLTGRVDSGHPLRRYLSYYSSAEEIQWFARNALAPDIIGINHYVTSERFLDERLDRYPGVPVGGNGKHRYVDVEAVRVLEEGSDGPYRIFKQAWERYGLPLAVTEVHLGCNRAEQLRWFREVYEAASQLKRDGADVRGVTAWALLGTFDWHCLVTRNDGVYEPGVFDLRSPAPRPTALARMVRALAAGESFDHPALAIPGWWRRPERIVFEPASRALPSRASIVRVGAERDAVESRAGALSMSRRLVADPRPLLIVGATGNLGRAFVRGCGEHGLSCHLVGRDETDLVVPASVDRMLEEIQPWGIINAAGYMRIDRAERERRRCHRENSDAASVLAAACARRGIALVTFSSDLVFDGKSRSPYVESDRPAPLNTYGWSKVVAESRVLREHPSALVIRTSEYFGPGDEENFLARALGSMARETSFVAANDAIVSPTYLPDLVEETLNLLIDGESGVWHLANEGIVTWFDFAREAARMAGLNDDWLIGKPLRELGFVAQRPRFSALGSERGLLLPPLEHALARYMEVRSPAGCDRCERLAAAGTA